MDLNRETIECISDMAKPVLFEVGGDTFCREGLHRVVPHVDRPAGICVNGLDSAVKLISTEISRVTCPVFVCVGDNHTVNIFTTYGDDYGRDNLYRVSCDVPEFREGWRDHEKAIIELRSRFIPNDGTNYLLDLLSRVSKEDGVTSEDNGVSQAVTARTGVSLKSVVHVNPRVALRPYRTFLEVEQPESEFLLRMDENGTVGLFEADGGMWAMDAKASIVAYFEESLSQLISDGKVVVMK